ncbi:MAG: UbiA family prenyltransferase [Deltaproteobacteria bacterium]|jgi:4-hydroxybenzoate polyprenyltransferase/phosphoglycolate phosphatase-like HAD superfamily hydrolase|nr:UbiA family prenyltransferase [Deltaproteobacteria bacterium]
MNSNGLHVLVVDLDGTLLKTDSLWELFFKTISQGHLAPLFWLLSGRVAFKSRLAHATQLDLDILPWNEAVIQLAKEYRNYNQEVWLATAADEFLAKKVVDHFDFFTGFIASDGRNNLKGKAKAAELARRFGEGGFVYVGNSSADLEVWRRASEAVVVGDHSLAVKAQSVNQKVTNIASNHSRFFTIRSIFHALRIHQWAKNILLFVPLLMGHLFTLAALNQVVLAFFSFCCFSSSGYILNDLLDISSDRCHPEKRLRPFASGALDLPKGAILFLIALMGSLILAWPLRHRFIILGILYLISSLIYSLKLKNIIFIDIIVLVLLYCVRIFAGGEAIDLEISQWLLSFSFFVFTALSLIKRLGEVSNITAGIIEHNSRRPYTVKDIILFQTITSGCICCAVLTLAIYVGDITALKRYQNPQILLFFCPILFYWLVRLMKLANEGKMPYDPVFFTLKDKVSWVSLGLGLLIYFIATVGL